MAFYYSLIIALFLWYQNTLLKTPLRESPQTIHKKSTSRLGGIAIMAALIIDSFIINWHEQSYDAYRLIIMCAMPSFLTGLIDDLFFDIISALSIMPIFFKKFPCVVIIALSPQ